MSATPVRLGRVGRAALIAAAIGLGVTALPFLPAWQGAVVGLSLAVFAILVEWSVRGSDARRVAGALIGCGAGLLFARALPLESTGALWLGSLSLAWIGLAVGARELHGLPMFSKAVSRRRGEPALLADPLAKVVDTSVIIDGRIADIVESGFVEGRMVVPQFVLRELQQVADSSDPLKRARGRKGLDVLKEIQENERVDVQITDRDPADITDVDGKLIALAEELSAKVLTNDYNLNKVAQLRGVMVLNVNDLANAVKPVVLPGESLAVQVIKEGKERNQGVGYLDDGTMVVVDGAGEQLGENLDVLVTSVIQTNAGKMIFAMPDEESPQERPRIARREGSATAGDADRDSAGAN